MVGADFLQECIDQGGQILSIRPSSYTVRIRMPSGDEKDIPNGSSMGEATLEISEEDLPEVVELKKSKFLRAMQNGGVITEYHKNKRGNYTLPSNQIEIYSNISQEYFDQFKTDESIEKPPPSTSTREHHHNDSFEDVMKKGGRIEDCIKFQSNSVFVLMPGGNIEQFGNISQELLDKYKERIKLRPELARDKNADHTHRKTEPLLTDARTPNDPDDEETLRGSSSNFGGTSSEPAQPRTPRTREAPRDHTNFLPLRHGKFTRLETMLAFTCLLLLILMSIFAGLYASGGWIKKSVIPDDKGLYSYINILYEENQKLLRNILEDDFKSPQVAVLPSPSSSIDKKNFYNLQSFYQSCMDEDRISQLGGAPLVPLLDRLFENFPVENKFSLFNNFGYQNDNLQQSDSLNLLNLTNTLSNLSTIGVRPLLEFFVDADAKNPSKNALYLTQSGLVLPSKEYYEDVQVMETYKSVMAELLGRALDNRSNFIIEMGYSTSDNLMDDIYEYSIERVWFRGWEEIADKIIEFEKSLAKISLSPEEFYDPEATYNMHTIKSLEKLSPTFFWSHYISSLLPSTVSDLPSKIILTSNQYFENLSLLVKKTHPQSLQAYFAWQIIAKHANSLDENFRAPLRRLMAKLRGVDENVKPKRWEVCLSSVDKALGFIAGRYYVLKAFGDIANNMITSIKEAFVNRLQDLDWLDDKTRKLAFEKVDAIIQKIGYPTKSPNTSDPLSLQDYYRNVKFDQDDYFGNLLSSHLWASDIQWKEVDKPVDRDIWYMSPQTVRTDPHSPPAWRVNGVLRNSPKFSEVFKCKPGSKMNPVKKCALW
ncbi:12528_t:CDS:10 [Racocetra fulgida]|uniref:12528_t:CDS:1 n=1 Tax=Racocetra fulgida TaxID=60492 RepID=A0A9N8VHX0_9GLOM|nr:12528_t:CDS:10 [Racocetra fulgida]